MREDTRARITDQLGRVAANGIKVMDMLFDHPVVNVATVAEWLSLTPAGANQLVNRLEKVGLLHETTGFARNRRFIFKPYIELRSEERRVGKEYRSGWMRSDERN